METEYLTIGEVSAVVLGPHSQKAFLFVHGAGGNKEEAVPFAEIAVPLGYQVIGIDLPVMASPSVVLSLLSAVKCYLDRYYSSVSVRANSIGCWYSLLAFQEQGVEQAMFVSPTLDMKTFIDCSGQKDEEYYSWVVENPVSSWKSPTFILRPDIDLVVNEKVYEAFTGRVQCVVQIMENGEHWFHTPEQLAVLRTWESKVLSRGL